MKLIVFYLFLCSSFLNAQQKVPLICNNQDGLLLATKFGEYNLIFKSQALDFLYSSDSTFVFDVNQKTLKIKSVSSGNISLSMENSSIKIKFDQPDSFSIFPFVKKSPGCEGNTQLQMKPAGKIFYQLLYDDCKIKGIILPSVNGRSLYVYFVFGKFSEQPAWDIIIKSFTGESVKILNSSEDGHPESILLGNNVDIRGEYREADPGFEFVAKPIDGKNKFYKIRQAATTAFPGILEYADVIKYDDKGKLKSSKIKAGNCD